MGPYRFAFHGAGARAHCFWAFAVRDGIWEPRTIEWLQSVLREGDIFLDIGAYLGSHALLASRLVGRSGSVIAFEPDPGVRALLERNAAANDAENVTVEALAIGDQAGFVQLDANGDSTSRIGSGAISVRQVALDDYCAERGIAPDVIKVDIEGHEAEALAGSRTAREARGLIVELHDELLRRKGIDAAELARSLGSFTPLEPAGDTYHVAYVR